MFHIITPFSRPQHLPALLSMFKLAGVGRFIWHPVYHQGEQVLDTAAAECPWVKPMGCPLWPDWDPCYFKINHALDTLELVDEDYYGFLCDDDTYDAGIFDALAGETAPIITISARRYGGSPQVGGGILHATRENMHPCHVGLEQFFVKGSVIKKYRFGNHGCADGELIEKLCNEHETSFRPDVFVNWNILSK